MYDRALVRGILQQIDEALGKIADRSSRIGSVEELTTTAAGQERLDGLCMLFIAIGEALSAHPEIDWRGAMGFRDIIAHQYFDIDAEQVYWICTHEITPLANAIKAVRDELSE
jgi:uncharacterized protein with HEPN domain